MLLPQMIVINLMKYAVLFVKNESWKMDWNG